MYKITKGDFILQSKHADVSLMNTLGAEFFLVWYNTPRKGKCVSMQYLPKNYPCVTITATANWKVRPHIAKLITAGWEQHSF